ncbi:MAG: hypothetical protein ACQGVK_17625 [Myxococcota bacterium]
MGLIVTPESADTLDAVLEELLPLERELPYANFAPVAARPGAAIALHRDRWLADGRWPVWVARAGDGRPLAALRADHRDFESEHFGLAMARIEQPIGVADESLRGAALRELYAAAAETLRGAGVAHVAARASTRDRVTPWVLQRAGAVHVDTQVSWMAALSGTPHDGPPTPSIRIEVLLGEDLEGLDARTWSRLADWAGRAFDRGPLVFDHTLPVERSSAVYTAWTEKAMKGEWADAVLVAWDGEEIVAFISMKSMPDVSDAAGALVCGRGLGATLPEYRGLFTAIQHEMIAARPLGASFMENETQAATIGSINVYAKLGFRFLRSTSTFHLHLEGGLPEAWSRTPAEPH